MLIPITPVPKPRQTRADVWQQRPAVLRYRNFADKLRDAYPLDLPERVKLVFYMPMPESWSKKKRAELSMLPHDQRPDLDNLIKSVLDALSPEDSYVYEIYAIKFWALEEDTVGSLQIEPL